MSQALAREKEELQAAESFTGIMAASEKQIAADTAMHEMEEGCFRQRTSQARLLSAPSLPRASGTTARAAKSVQGPSQLGGIRRVVLTWLARV